MRIIIGNRPVRRVGVDVSFDELMSGMINRLSNPQHRIATPHVDRLGRPKAEDGE
jgi:hypothetical protein